MIMIIIRIKSEISLNSETDFSKDTIENSEEKGSVVSILYGKSGYDNKTGSCSIL